MRNFKIFNKIFLSHAFIGLFSALVISFIFYIIFRNALIQRTIDQLSSINILKKNQVENYFVRSKNNLEFLLNQNEFRILFDSVGNHSLDKSGKLGFQLDQKLVEIKKLYEFENISIVNRDYSKIYSTSTDTNYLNVFSDKRLADSCCRLTVGYFSIIDASEYSGSGNTVLLYVLPLASSQRNFHGFIVITENFQKIQNILHERTGMGNTGESYLAGSDNKMRSSSRFFPNAAPLSIHVQTEAVQNAILGKSRREIIVDYRGEKVLSVSRKFDNPGLKWVIISEIDFDEAIKPIIQLRNYLIIITLVIILIIILITYFISNAISKPVLELKSIITTLSKGIIPSRKVEIKSKDEIGEITDAVNELIEGFKHTTEFANELGKGNFATSYSLLSDYDTLGQALINMRDELKSLNEREVKLMRERAAALIEGQENERKRIISELHDGVGQLLTVVKLRLEMVQGQAELKGEIMSLVNETIAEVRRISYNVMPSSIIDFGLKAALKGLCENIKKYAKIEIDFEYIEETEISTNFEISIAVFRIVQEGLNNIIKHSGATEVNLHVIDKEEDIYVFLKDNGKGFDRKAVKDKGGFGLRSMNERAKLLNGNVEMQSSLGSGTTIEVFIPRK